MALVDDQGSVISSSRASSPTNVQRVAGVQTRFLRQFSVPRPSLAQAPQQVPIVAESVRPGTHTPRASLFGPIVNPADVQYTYSHSVSPTRVVNSAPNSLVDSVINAMRSEMRGFRFEMAQHAESMSKCAHLMEDVVAAMKTHQQCQPSQVDIDLAPTIREIRQCRTDVVEDLKNDVNDVRDDIRDTKSEIDERIKQILDMLKGTTKIPAEVKASEASYKTMAYDDSRCSWAALHPHKLKFAPRRYMRKSKPANGPDKAVVEEDTTAAFQDETYFLRFLSEVSEEQLRMKKAGRSDAVRLRILMPGPTILEDDPLHAAWVRQLKDNRIALVSQHLANRNVPAEVVYEDSLEPAVCFEVKT